MPIVNDTGFSDEPVSTTLILNELRLSTDRNLCVQVPNDIEPQLLEPYFDRIAMIVVEFPVFSDGRSFSIAQRLRGLGFKKPLRAKGHVIADQYSYARSCGFDDVEISFERAARQPEADWRQAAILSRPYRSKWANAPVAGTIPASTDSIAPFEFSHF